MKRRKQMLDRRGKTGPVRFPVTLMTVLAMLAGAWFPAMAQETPASAQPAGGTPGQESSLYIIGKEDVLQVDIYGEETLSVPRVPVRPDGRISLPLVGDVIAEGETTERLSEKLSTLYEEHVLAPVISVIVVEVNSFKVFVLGNVSRPGELVFGRETTLLQALALCGGFGQFANTKRIILIREGPGGATRIEINYEKIVSGESLSMNIKLKPGDTIVVP